MPRPTPLALAALAATLLGAPAAASAEGTVIVKYRRGISSIQRHVVSRRAGVRRVVGTVRGQGSRVVAVSGDPAAATRRLAASPSVTYAEPNALLHASATPDDPLYAQLPGLAAVHAPDAWDAAGLGAFPATGGVPVGIVDTGIDASHEDLAGRVKACAHAQDGRVTAGSCADDNDHGTHVAGTIGAAANNGVGVVGVAFSSPLIVCKALDASGAGRLADVASCVRWAHERGARVISLSLGGGASVTLRNAVRSAWAAGSRTGSVVVAAAGNDGSGATEYPAGYPEVLSVAAVDAAGRHAAFSNANDDVELAAPGVDVLSTKRGGGYVRFSGTSMATPHVAGVVALAWDAHRRSTAENIRARLDTGADDLGAPGRDPIYGFGMVDAARAVSAR